MESILLEYSYCMIYVLGLTITTLFLSKEEYSLKRVIIFIPVYAVVNYLISETIAVGLFELVIINSLIILSDFIYCCILLKNRNFQYLFYSSLYFGIYALTINILTYLFSVLPTFDIFMFLITSISRSKMVFLINGLTVMLIILLDYLKLLPDKVIITREYVLFNTINITIFYIQLILFNVSMKEIIHNNIIITIILFVVWIMFYQVLIKYVNTSIKNEQLMIQEISNNYVDKYIDFYKQESDKLRKIKHDIKNHKLLLENMNNEMLNEYIGDIFDDLDKQYIQTGNLFVDSCLYIKSQEYPSIIFDYDISINGLKINEKDLNSILFNLIDNACNEALKTDLKVKIELKYIRNILKIKVVNKCVTKPSFVTTKGIGHGYGLKIIASIVDKYNGNIFYDFHDNIISFNISLTV